ncbi:DUF87 domain-containing protein [bacterium 3DAC]|nr:DUF87 domain-containing protein [bacterium 3DAC]
MSDFRDIKGKVLTEGDFTNYVERLVSESTDYVYFASAWVKGGMFRRLINKIDRNSVDIRLVVRGSEKKDFEITDPGVFDIEGVKYAYHPNLHAKMIIVDGKKALIGSANITYSGLTENGNREVAILVEDEDTVSELAEYFQNIWKEAYEYSPDLVGMIMNPSRSSHLEVLLLRPSYEVPEGTLLLVPWDTEDGRVEIILRVDSVIAYNTGFFLNPFGSESSGIFPNPAEITFVNDEDKPHAWRVGALLSYVEKSSNFYMARCSVLGVHVVDDDKSRIEPLFSAPPIGLPVYKDSSGKLAEMLRKDMSGTPMDIPVEIGVLYGTKVPIHVDVSYLARRDRARHMAVLGTTGSGKSFFAQKILVPGILETVSKEGLFKDWFKIVVIDPHGEWSEKLREQSIPIKEVKVPEFTVPLSYSEDQWRKFFGAFDVKFGGSDGAGKHNKKVFWEILRNHKGDSDYPYFLNELADAIGQFKEVYKTSGKNAEDKPLDDIVVSEISEVLKEDAASLKASVFDLTTEDSEEPVIVINLADVLDSSMRTDIAGLIVMSFFNKMRQMKDKGEDASTILVVEEAHNFAPEKGYGETSASKDNMSLTAISKVAAEGRKFGLGMVIITQRPASVNKYVLSQMGTYAIFRLVNKNDLDAVMSAIEYAGADVLSKLPSLKTGMALLSGLSLPFPVFVNMRKGQR